jgi:hypothetical protein
VATWRCANDTLTTSLTLKPGQPGSKQVALKLSISARITDDRVHPIMEPDVSIWEITFDRPHNDVVRRPDDLSYFRTLARRAFEKIKVHHGEDSELFIFPAVLVSCVIKLSRTRQSKAHLPMEIYHQTICGGFMRRIREA